MIAPLFLAATTAASSPLSVPDLVAHKADYQGRMVEVRGWMGECRGRGCVIYAAPSEPKGREPNPGRRTWLSIGPAGRAFDDKATRLRGKAVLLRGRFDGTCLSSGEASHSSSGDETITVCTDRAPEIQPDGPQSLTPVKDR